MIYYFLFGPETRRRIVVREKDERKAWKINLKNH